MKKILTCTLTLVMLIGLSACGQKVTPEQRFEAVMQQNSKIMSMECETTNNMTMTVGSETMDMAMDMVIKMQRTADNLEMSMETKNQVLGQELDMTAYYKDGYYYMTMMGEKLKMPMDVEAMMKQVEGANLQQLAPADMQKLEMTTKDGDYQFTYDVKPEAMNNYIQQAMGLVGDLGAAPEDMKIISMNGVITTDKKNTIKHQTTSMEMQLTVEKQTMNIKMDMDCEYESVGKPVKIEYPSDLDTYTEMDVPIAS